MAEMQSPTQREGSSGGPTTTAARGAPIDYTKKTGQKFNGRPFHEKMPDETVHIPPIALFCLGGIGVLAGILTNFWQMITTFIAFWAMFNPKARPVDFQRQPVLVLICGLIAFSFQLALAFLVFRLDRAWKKNKISAEASGKAAAGAVVEVVQQADLVLLWSLLGFVVDTIGDYTFISLYTGGVDILTGVFLIFIYAVALYSMSTVGFVRSLEYVWSGLAAFVKIAASAATK